MDCIACFEPNATYKILCGSPVGHVMCEDCEVDWRLKMKYDNGFDLKCPMCRVPETELNPARTVKSMECELAMLRSERARAHHRVSLKDLVMPSCASVRAKAYPAATSKDLTRFTRMKKNIVKDIGIRRDAAIRQAAAPAAAPAPPEAVIPPSWLAGMIASIWAERPQYRAEIARVDEYRMELLRRSPAYQAGLASAQAVQQARPVRPRRVKCESGKPCTTASRTQRKCDRCDKRVCRSCKECLTH